MVRPSAYMSRSSPIAGPGACGMDYPFKVAAFSGGSVALNSKATLACPIITTIDTWIEEVVKPAALLYFGEPVVDLQGGSYSCRPRNNQRGAKYSEHAFGNAFDIMGFTLASGREVKVVRGWRGQAVEQEFLREVFVGACRYFKTVLGPGADAFHYDHFHIDLARHDPRGERQICKPLVQFASRLAPKRPGQQPANSVELAALDMEQDVPIEGPSSHRRAPPAAAVAQAPAVLPRIAPPTTTFASPGYSTAQMYRPQPPGLPPIALHSDPNRPLPPLRPPQSLNAHGIY